MADLMHELRESGKTDGDEDDKAAPIEAVDGR